MSDQSVPSGLQFDKAEYVAPQRLACALCKAGIASDYFSVNGHTICQSCRRQIGTGRKPVTLQNFARAAVLGLGAAIVGAVIWGVVRSASGGDWGVIAVVVGLLVGNAVARGSQKTGGWVFQALAMALTYLTIAMSWVPEVNKELGGTVDAHVGQGPIHWVMVAGIAFVMPVLANMSLSMNGLLGFLINGYALYEGWKTNKRAKLLITGPFQLQVSASVPAPEPVPVPVPEVISGG